MNTVISRVANREGWSFPAFRFVLEALRSLAHCAKLGDDWVPNEDLVSKFYDIWISALPE